MSFQILFYAALVTLVRGGVIHQAPVAAVATYAAAAPIAYSAHPSPIATHVSYANPHAHIAYNAHAGHLTYSAPHLTYATHHSPAPAIAKVIAPVAKAVVDTEYDPNPQYSYAYDVQDSVTGDSKNHHESRHGDIVQGSYSLTDSDGTRRTVDYTADPVNGFNAVVRKEPLAHAAPVIAKTITAPVVAKVAPAPFVAKYAPAHAAIPVSYAAASPAVAYAAPVQYVSKLAYSSPYVHYKH